SIKILSEYERGVIFRLGRLLDTAKGPGVILVFGPIDRIVRIDMRQQALEIPPQDIITRDNVTLKVNAVVYWRVMDSRLAVVQVQNYYWQTQQFAQTTLRSVLGEVDLDELLAHRSEEHTSELQSPCNLVCRLLLEKKKKERRRQRVEHEQERELEPD